MGGHEEGNEGGDKLEKDIMIYMYEVDLMKSIISYANLNHLKILNKNSGHQPVHIGISRLP